LDMTKANVTLLAIAHEEPHTGNQVATIALGVNEPFIKMTGGSFTLSGDGNNLVNLDSMSSGVGLIANGGTITTNGALLGIEKGTQGDPNPFLQLTGTTVTVNGSHSFIEVAFNPSSVSGPLLSATNSTI